MGDHDARKQRNLQLLAVDDDASIVALLERLIEQQLGDRVDFHAFTDSQQAIEALDSRCFDILITDLEMPGVDGLSILRQAKRRNPWTQVLFMTAHSTLDAVSAAVENGASDYLLKPIVKAELMELLEQAYARFLRWQTAVSGTLRSTLAAAD